MPPGRKSQDVRGRLATVSLASGAVTFRQQKSRMLSSRKFASCHLSSDCLTLAFEADRGAPTAAFGHTLACLLTAKLPIASACCAGFLWSGRRGRCSVQGHTPLVLHSSSVRKLRQRDSTSKVWSIYKAICMACDSLWLWSNVEAVR